MNPLELDNKNYQEMKKNLIHPWEKRMRVMNVIIFICAVIASIIYAGIIIQSPESFSNEEMQGAFIVFGIIGLILVQLGRQYGKTRATSVQLNEEQFPEIYALVKTQSAQLDLSYIPEVYLTQQGGVLNAFATSFFSKKYISLNSAIFEIAYLEHKDIEAVAFVIAHELTHLKRKHATTLMTSIEALPGMIPIWGMAYSRVREYTCDRHAVWLAPNGKESLILLATGKHMYKHVDLDVYINDSKQYKGFFIWLYNLNASHPIGPKRMKAIMDTSSWGKVF